MKVPPMSRFRTLFAVMGFAAASLAADTVAATPLPVRFSWVRLAGAEHCPDRPRVEAAIAARLGYTPFAESATRSVEAVVSRDGARWRAQIWVRDVDGTALGARELTSEEESCQPLVEAAALVLAIGIDPDVASRGSPRPGPPLSLEPPNPSAPDPTVPTRWSLLARFAFARGILPSTSYGVGLVGSVSIAERLHGIVGATFWPETQTPRGLYSFGLTDFEIGACGDILRSTRVAFQGCVAGLVGILHETDLGGLPMLPGNNGWGAIAADLGLSIRLPFGLALRAMARGITPLTPRISSPEFSQSPIGGEGAFFLGW